MNKNSEVSEAIEYQRPELIEYGKAVDLTKGKTQNGWEDTDNDNYYNDGPGDPPP